MSPIAPLLETYLDRFPKPLESLATDYFNSALNEGPRRGDCRTRQSAQIG